MCYFNLIENVLLKISIHILLGNIHIPTPNPKICLTLYVPPDTFYQSSFPRFSLELTVSLVLSKR